VNDEDERIRFRRRLQRFDSQRIRAMEMSAAMRAAFDRPDVIEPPATELMSPATFFAMVARVSK
jgi:hypothetical protein